MTLLLISAYQKFEIKIPKNSKQKIFATNNHAIVVWAVLGRISIHISILFCIGSVSPKDLSRVSRIGIADNSDTVSSILIIHFCVQNGYSGFNCSINYIKHEKLS